MEQEFSCELYSPLSPWGLQKLMNPERMFSTEILETKKALGNECQGLWGMSLAVTVWLLPRVLPLPHSFSNRAVKGWHYHIPIHHMREQREMETQMKKEHTDKGTHHFHTWTLPEGFQFLSFSILSCSYPLGGLLSHRLGNTNCAISQGCGQ